jgi:hypothetical protein
VAITALENYSPLLVDFTILDASGGSIAPPDPPGSGGGGGGSVVSIDLSGGTTGLTVTGGPITTSGTLLLHLANTAMLSGRNAAGSGDVALIGTDASNRVVLSTYGTMDAALSDLQLVSTTSNLDRGFVSYQATNLPLGSMFVGKRSGGTASAPTIIGSNNPIANFAALSYDGVDFLRTGIMQFASQTVGGAGNVPTQWGLYLSDGSADAIMTSPKMTVNDQGNVVILAALSGVTLQAGPIKFPNGHGALNQVMIDDGAGNLSWANVAATSVALTYKEIGFGDITNQMTGSANLTWDDSISLQTITGLNGGVQIVSPDGHTAIMARDGSSDALVISNGTVGGYVDQYSMLFSGSAVANGYAASANLQSFSNYRYSFAGRTDFSVVLAFKPSVVDATTRGIWYAHGAISLRHDSTKTRFYSGDTVHTSTAANNVDGAPLTSGATNLIIMTFTGGGGTIVRTIYVNNVAATTSQAGGVAITTNSDTGFGWAYDGLNGGTPNAPGTGYYDNCFGYNRCLSAAECTAIWNGGSLVGMNAIPQDFAWRIRFDDATAVFTDDIPGGDTFIKNDVSVSITTQQPPLWPATSFVPTASRTVLKHFENPAGTPELQLGGDSTTTYSLLPATATTVGAAGGATALPATPLGYASFKINGTVVKIPYYNL